MMADTLSFNAKIGVVNFWVHHKSDRKSCVIPTADRNINWLTGQNVQRLQIFAIFASQLSGILKTEQMGVMNNKMMFPSINKTSFIGTVGRWSVLAWHIKHGRHIINWLIA